MDLKASWFRILAEFHLREMSYFLVPSFLPLAAARLQKNTFIVCFIIVFEIIACQLLKCLPVVLLIVKVILDVM